MADEILWACIACGGPLPGIVEEYNQDVHGEWILSQFIDPATERYQYKFDDGTNQYTHDTDSSTIDNAMQHNTGIAMGYSPGDQPETGALWWNPSDQEMYVFYEDAWMRMDMEGATANDEGNYLIQNS
jgi:hypothetical protein